MPSDPNVDDRLEALERRIRELEDAAEIRALTATYNETFDNMEVEAFVSTFLPDGEFSVDDGEPLVGRSALAAFHREIGFGKVHHTADHRVMVDGDRATQVCTLILGSRHPDKAFGSAEFENSGRYLDELVRTPEGWKFRRRTFYADAAITE